MEKAVGKQVRHQIDQLFQNGTLTGLNDAELLERYLSRRDEAAFEAIVRLHGPMVLGLCRRMLRDRNEIEDAFQATFLILVRKAPSLRDRRLLGNWLYGVAYRVASRARKNAFKRNAGRQPSDHLDDAATEQETSSSLEFRDLLPVLDEELARLPEKYRRPIVLCHLDGRTHEQSAGQLGIPVGTVRSRLARGRALLKQRLERRGVAPGVIALAFNGSPTAIPFAASAPVSLIHGTVTSVGQFVMCSSSGASATASAVSAVSLARGVMMSMFIGNAKFAAVGILTATVVGFGAMQGVRAVGTAMSGEVQKSEAKVAAPSDLGKQKIEVQKVSGKQPVSPPDERGEFSDMDPGIPVEAHVLELKRRLERLESQSASEPRRREDGDRAVRAAPVLDVTGFKVPAGMSVPELEAEFRIALRRYQQSRQLNANARLGAMEVDEALAEVHRVIAKMERLYHDFEDEFARLRYQRSRKEAERSVVQANLEVAARKVSQNKQAKEGFTPSEEDAAQDEYVFKLAKAQEDAVLADLELLDWWLRPREGPLGERPFRRLEKVLSEAKAFERSIDPQKEASPPANAK